MFILFQGKDKIDALKTLRSFSLTGVWLRSVLESTESDSALLAYSVSLRKVWLRAVLVNYGILLRWRFLKAQKMFDFGQR